MLNKIPDLNRLGLFHSVYLVKSVSRAAESLHVTRSAVSQAIKLLESEIGQPLFTRRGRLIYPTSLGTEVFGLIDPMITLLKERSEDWNSRVERMHGQIKIVAPPLFASTKLVPAIASFQRIYPKMKFSIKSLPTRQILAELENDRIDFCIADSFEIFIGKRNLIREIKLLDEHELMVCSKLYAKNFKDLPGPSFGELSKMNFVCYDSQGADAKEWFKAIFHKSPDQIEPVLSVGSIFEVQAAVRAHLGLGLLPFWVIEKEVRAGDLVVLYPKKTHILNKISLLQLRDKKVSRREQLFIQHLLKTLS